MTRSQQAMPATQFRRKNGQQSSCENCRKSKLACDHVTPHCGRCVRLQKTNTCVYLVSPLTKPRPDAPKSSGVVKRSTKTQLRPLTTSIFTVHHPVVADSPPSEFEPFIRDPSQGLCLERVSNARSEAPRQTTSWGSIFSEFNINVEPEITAPGATAGSSLGWKDPELLQHATTALAQIPSQVMCEGLLEHALKYPDFGCFEPYLRQLHCGWWGFFGGNLERSLDPLSITPVLERLWANTASQVNDRVASNSPCWLATCSETNTTWSSLAYLLSEYGSACASLPPSHHLLSKYDKGQMCRDLGKGVKACLAICEAQNILSVDLVNARASMVLLQNSHDGDDLSTMSYPVTPLTNHAADHNYTNIAHLARLVTHMGLHMGSIYTSFVQTQLEHKAFHRAYIMDKSIATSSGRPPQLTRRFNQCPLPLELSDGQLLLSGQELAFACDLLDSEGWSTIDRSYPISYLRALSMLGNHREEILELTLGPSPPNLVNLQRYDDGSTHELSSRGLVMSHLQATYTRLPLRLQYDPDDNAHLEPFDFLNVIFLHLEYNKSIFLLHRLSRGVPLSQNEPLLSSAKAILNVIIMLYTNRDRLGNMFLFFPWAVMSYGTPAAAILAAELLTRPQYLSAVANGSTIYSRSETIQELSVFISCLKSIPTAEGNHAPCRRVERTLRKILDQVLDSPPTIAAATITPTTTPEMDGDSAIDLDIDWETFATGPCDPDYAQWLDTSTFADTFDPVDFEINDLGLHIPSDFCFGGPSKAWG
ncbi:uncharacterized protein N7459_007005 [Penicillium hispanicum]|uniref:uncharacterized protein n=1 Tax=Penicillium hispanicum TaxID=1080232 RepID=UPI00253FF938|nr:uncharacterized protein N7459_007005 [Penicillium hispanicum]KAJ5578041.1 hypothetical protein N7459_007005 [Penicillium hispanicum]